MNSKQKSIPNATELDLGIRKVSRMNFSHIITLPKEFVKNTPYGEIREVKIIMLEDGCLKLVPIHQQKEPDDLVNL